MDFHCNCLLSVNSLLINECVRNFLLFGQGKKFEESREKKSTDLRARKHVNDSLQTLSLGLGMEKKRRRDCLII